MLQGDAYNLIKNLSLTDENFDVAKQTLHLRYLRPEYFKDSLLQALISFKIPMPNKDFTNVLSNLITLEVQLGELRNLDCDVLQGPAEAIARHIIHMAMPGPILNEFQIARGKHQPKSGSFFDKACDVLDRVVAK